MKRKGGSKKRKPAPLKVKPTDDGLHLLDSILWLDSKQNGELSFLSSAVQSGANNVPQVITTEETVEILGTRRIKPRALVCQYNRPFSIGKLKMELLPSGSVLGGASLYVESEKGRFLYAPHLQTQKNITVRQMQLKKAQTLILGAFQEDPAKSFPNRKKEKDRLLAAVKRDIKNGFYPSIVCPPVATAQEITKLLSDEGIPVAVHSTIHRINKVYENHGSNLGTYSLYSPKHTKKRVLLFPMKNNSLANLKHPLPDSPVFFVQDTLSKATGPESLRDVDERFYISTICDGKDLREVITAVSPREVYIFGPYAKSFADELKGACKTIRPLFSNEQPTLF